RPFQAGGQPRVLPGAPVHLGSDLASFALRLRTGGQPLCFSIYLMEAETHRARTPALDTFARSSRRSHRGRPRTASGGTSSRPARHMERLDSDAAPATTAVQGPIDIHARRG